MVVSSFFGLNFVLLCTLSFVKEELGRREGEHGPFLALPCACERKPKASELLLVPHTAPKLYIYMYFFLALPVLFSPFYCSVPEAYMKRKKMDSRTEQNSVLRSPSSPHPGRRANI